MFRRRLKLLAACLVLATMASLVTASPVTATEGEPFCDVSSTDYYRDAVAWAKSVGITSGMTERRFDPDGSTTRAQLMTLLYRFITWRDGSTPTAAAPHTFTDVPAGAFFEAAVQWAVATELTTGVSPTEFAPDQPTTRAELAVFIHRLTPDAIDGGAAPFGDVGRADWFHDAVAWMAAAGLTTGTAPGIYDPSATASRAQIITFLWRFAASPAPGEHSVPRCPTTWTAIGDSVMQGTELGGVMTGSTFTPWVGTLNTQGCRRPLITTYSRTCGGGEVPSTLRVIEGYVAAGTLGDVLFIHTGTNDPVDATTLDRLINAASTATTIWIITIRTPWRSQDAQNAAIADAVVRWDGVRDVRMLDWHSLIDVNPGWVGRDGIHLSTTGRYGFRDMIGTALDMS